MLQYVLSVMGEAHFCCIMCFVSSFLVILAGLGGTLVLLAVYKHALPALPISIFLAVTFYVLTRFIIEPWIHVVMNTPFYV